MLERFPLSVTTNLGWSTAFGDTTAVPPHRHVFTGGSDSVRGFRDGTLGPRDSLGNPYGGDAGMSAQFEAIMPLPAKFQTSARLSLFYDIGQSFYLGDTEFRNKRGDRTDYRFDLGELRSSAGIAVQWLSPMGLFRFSYADAAALPGRDAPRVRRRARGIPVFSRHRVLTHRWSECNENSQRSIRWPWSARRRSRSTPAAAAVRRAARIRRSACST